MKGCLINHIIIIIGKCWLQKRGGTLHCYKYSISLHFKATFHEKVMTNLSGLCYFLFTPTTACTWIFSIQNCCFPGSAKIVEKYLAKYNLRPISSGPGYQNCKLLCPERLIIFLIIFWFAAASSLPSNLLYYWHFTLGTQ